MPLCQLLIYLQLRSVLGLSFLHLWYGCHLSGERQLLTTREKFKEFKHSPLPKYQAASTNINLVPLPVVSGAS